tara:strand:- start:1586 stop:2473 length:888 start_codon:yes stop_codon:yes gene_type:complete
MTNGIIMFALNGQALDKNNNKIKIDYVKMALANAVSIQRHMTNNKVALVTDRKGKQHLDTLNGTQYFTHVIVETPKYSGTGPNTNHFVNTRSMRSGNNTIRLPWQNQSRPDVYRLSPYDKTLLIDSDYFIFDNTLDEVFETDKNILCGKHVEEIGHQESLIDYERLHHQTLKLFWATVLYFTKSKEAKMMFDIMNMVKHNWQYYSKLYKFDNSRTYRNDFAVSVALHMMQGKKETTQYDLPFKLMCLADKNIMNTSTSFYFRGKQSWAGSGFPRQNLHIMNKESAMKISEEILNG